MSYLYGMKDLASAFVRLKAAPPVFPGIPVVGRGLGGLPRRGLETQRSNPFVMAIAWTSIDANTHRHTNISVDSQGNLYVGVQSDRATLVKIGRNQEVQWVRRSSVASSYSGPVVYFDNAIFFFIWGTGTQNFPYICKVNPETGLVESSRKVSHEGTVHHAAVVNGYLYCLGVFKDSGGASRQGVVRIATNDLQETSYIGSPGTTDQAAACYDASTYHGMVIQSRLLTYTKVGVSTGSALSSRGFAGHTVSSSIDLAMHGVEVNDAGEVFFSWVGTPSADSLPTYYYHYVTKLNSDGSEAWTKRFTAVIPNNGSYRSSGAFSKLPGGDLLHIGWQTIGGAVTLVMSRISQEGNLAFSRSLRMPGALGEITRITVDGVDVIFAVGYSGSAVGSNYRDVLIFRLPCDGSLTGVYAVGSAEFEYAEVAGVLTSAGITKTTTTLYSPATPSNTAASLSMSDYTNYSATQTPLK